MNHGVEVVSGDWRRLAQQATAIRLQVFVAEQQVPLTEEWDGKDHACVHFIAYLTDNSQLSRPQAVGTARLLPDGHIGRMAVLESERGKGVGSALLKAALASARQQGHSVAALSAQRHAIPFYARLGFVAQGPYYLDAGIEHRDMTVSLHP